MATLIDPQNGCTSSHTTLWAGSSRTRTRQADTLCSRGQEETKQGLKITKTEAVDGTAAKVTTYLLEDLPAENGMLTGTTLGNVTDTYAYNAFGEVTDYAAKYNGADLYRVHQELDKLGRITSRTEMVLGETHAYVYGYDQAGRLTNERKDGVLISKYEYDANGNRLAHTTPDGTTNGTYDDQDRLLAYGDATYEYTANGELLSKTDAGGTTYYAYDVLGNLTGVTFPDGTRIDYVIDGQNRRIGKKVNGVLVQGFLYQDNFEPVAELDEAGNVVARFIYASRSHIPDYMVQNGVTYRIVSDHLGSPQLVVNVATGQVAQRMEYDEFGNVTQDTNPGFQPFGFAGSIYDQDAKSLKLGCREYDATIGRWCSRDYSKYLAIASNLYTYSYSDPINLIDLDGKRAYGIGIGASVYKAIGAQVNVTFVWDDEGNYGVLYSIGGGVGVEITTKVTVGAATYDNSETIYDLDGWFVTASAYFLIGATWDLLHNGEITNVSGIGIGGDLSGGFSFLVPYSDINKWLIKAYLKSMGFKDEDIERMLAQIDKLIKNNSKGECDK